jgi:hypothetical protein
MHFFLYILQMAHNRADESKSDELVIICNIKRFKPLVSGSGTIIQTN